MSDDSEGDDETDEERRVTRYKKVPGPPEDGPWGILTIAMFALILLGVVVCALGDVNVGI